jgi:hypothetical protein
VSRAGAWVSCEHNLLEEAGQVGIGALSIPRDDTCLPVSPQIEQVHDTVGPMEGYQVICQRLATAVNQAVPKGDEVRHELDVVDHEPPRPEDLVALVKDAPAEVGEEGPELFGQPPSKSFLQPIQLNSVAGSAVMCCGASASRTASVCSIVTGNSLPTGCMSSMFSS